ncbi:MAG: hypothetical protein ABR507_00415 [Actinomycetota bacterium]
MNGKKGLRNIALATVLAAAGAVPMLAHADGTDLGKACLVATADSSSSSGCRGWRSPDSVDQNISGAGDWHVVVLRTIDGHTTRITYPGHESALPQAGFGTFKAATDVVDSATASGPGSYALVGTPNDIEQRPGR